MFIPELDLVVLPIPFASVPCERENSTTEQKNRGWLGYEDKALGNVRSCMFYDFKANVPNAVGY
jgi:hypothetical protein